MLKGSAGLFCCDLGRMESFCRESLFAGAQKYCEVLRGLGKGKKAGRETRDRSAESGRGKGGERLVLPVGFACWFCQKKDYSREDSNLQGLPHALLRRTRLPVPPREHRTGRIIHDFIGLGNQQNHFPFAPPSFSRFAAIFFLSTGIQKETMEGMIFDSIRSAVDFASHLPRYKEILSVLLKYGIANELRLAALQHLLGMEPPPPQANKSALLSQPLPVRVRLALEELGPTFIKFGQIISSRRDLVTDDFYRELVKLQANVPPIPGEQAREIILEELGETPESLFAEFDDTPVGAASMAQVHRATLLDGSLVAVKVQRPNIEETISLDLAIAQDIAAFVARHVPELSGLNPVGVVNEFSSSMMRELDFSVEAANSARFAEQFEKEPLVKCPKIYPSFSTKKVLTMEFVSGLPPDEPEKLAENGIDPIALSESISRIIFQQVFEFGFFHGDPHPGNMAILQGGVTALYDYGMMGSFSPEFRLSIARMLGGLAEKNHRSVMRAILEMSEEGFPDDPNKMLAEVEAFSEAYLNKPLKEIELGFVFSKLLELLRNGKLRMRGSFYLGIKALSQVEAIGRVLNPDLNFVQLAAPYAAQIIVGKYRPQKIVSLFQHLLGDAIDFLEEFPHDFRTLYRRIKRGDVSLPLEHKIDPQGFEPLRKTLDSIANRLTNAILSASVLVCSSILVLAHVPPMVFGVSLIGGIGLFLGTYMCLRLALSIWKHGGL